MTNHPPKFIAMTGASGGGKSTLVEELARRGYAVQREIGREIVAQQVQEGGTALPWDDRRAFRDLLFSRSVEAYDTLAASDAERVFFDRTHMDAVAYSHAIGLDVSEVMMEAMKVRCFDTIFICPPWPEIFEHDQERAHDLAFALTEHEANVRLLADLGYAVTEVPKLDVTARVEFVLDACGFG